MKGRGGRGHGRGRERGGRDGRGGPNPSSDKDKGSAKIRMTLADYIYYVGASRQAREFLVFTEFIINHIRKTFEFGNNIANALDARFHVDFITLMPELQESKATDPKVLQRETGQYAIHYEAEVK
jgi:hypothetical protein